MSCESPEELLGSTPYQVRKAHFHMQSFLVLSNSYHLPQLPLERNDTV